MQRPQQEHLIRPAAEITNLAEFVVLGSVEQPPLECTVSRQAARATAWIRRLGADLSST